MTPTIDLSEGNEGVLIPVKVHAGARRNALRGIHAGRLKIDVCAAPEKGKANRAVCECLAKCLGVARSKLTVVAGKTSPLKTLAVLGCTVEEVRELLLLELKGLAE